MNHNCVVVAGGTRARFFKLQEAEFPEVEPGPNLLEVNDLIDPQRQAHDGQLWSEAKSGRNRGPNGGPAHGYDDHRSQHEDEFERRFARSVAEETARLAREQKARNVVLVAQKRILGFLRHELESLARAGITIRELPKDLSKLSPHELHEHLAREKLVPKRRRPMS